MLAPESITNFVIEVATALSWTAEKKLSLLSGWLSSLVLSSPSAAGAGVASGELKSMEGFRRGTGASA